MNEGNGQFATGNSHSLSSEAEILKLLVFGRKHVANEIYERVLYSLR